MKDIVDEFWDTILHGQSELFRIFNMKDERKNYDNGKDITIPLSYDDK